jgi:hypothetical protein
VAKAIDETLNKIVAAGKTPGLPATAENVAAALRRGVRYTYTHLPSLLIPAAQTYLGAGRGT